jgi:hypothetical protein
VLELSTAEIAELLDTTVAAVNSALQRARKTLGERASGPQQAELASLGEAGQRALVRDFVHAWESADLGALLQLLTEDARFVMPPLAAWFDGRQNVGKFLRRARVRDTLAPAAAVRERAARLRLLLDAAGHERIPTLGGQRLEPAGGADRGDRRLPGSRGPRPLRPAGGSANRKSLRRAMSFRAALSLPFDEASEAPAHPRREIPMRKLIVANIVSLDGYYEGPNRNVMALPMDHSFDAYNVDGPRAADTLLLGANCYGMFKGFWPQMKEHAQATPVHREISRLNDAIEKWSSRIACRASRPTRGAAPRASCAEPRRSDRSLRSREGPGRDILVFGSRRSWNDLAERRARRRAAFDGRRGGAGRRNAGLLASPARAVSLDRYAPRWEGSSNVLFQYAVEPATARRAGATARG